MLHLLAMMAEPVYSRLPFGSCMYFTHADMVRFVILIVKRTSFLKLTMLSFTPCFVHADRDPGIALLSLALSIH